jgi:hypothetical protein
MDAAEVADLLASPERYREARDILAAAVLHGAVALDLDALTEFAVNRFGIDHQHAHDLADQFLVDLKTDRRAQVKHAD